MVLDTLESLMNGYISYLVHKWTYNILTSLTWLSTGDQTHMEPTPPMFYTQHTITNFYTPI